MVRNGNGNFMLNERVNIDTTTFSKNAALFEAHEIPELVQEEIKLVIDAQAAIRNNDLEISVYAPVTESNPYTHAYNGKNYTLKDYITEFRKINMGPLVHRGIDTLSVAKTVGDIIISKTENITDVLNIFGGFGTAYDVAVAIFGELHTGSSGDQIQMNIAYDRLQKATYVLNEGLGSYQPGCISHKVWINTTSIYQFYGEAGYGESRDYRVNREFFSANYRRPGDTAVRYAGDYYYTDPYLATVIMGNQVSFSGM